MDVIWTGKSCFFVPARMNMQWNRVIRQFKYRIMIFLCYMILKSKIILIKLPIIYTYIRTWTTPKFDIYLFVFFLTVNCITSRLSVFKLYNMCNKLFQCIEQINSLPDYILKSLNAKFCDGRYVGRKICDGRYFGREKTVVDRKWN